MVEGVMLPRRSGLLSYVEESSSTESGGSSRLSVSLGDEEKWSERSSSVDDEDEDWGSSDPPTCFFFQCQQAPGKSRRRRRSYGDLSPRSGDVRQSSPMHAENSRRSESLPRRDTKKRTPSVVRQRFSALNELPVDVAKKRLLEALKRNEGEPSSVEVKDAAANLAHEARAAAANSDENDGALFRATGKWRALTKAHFPGGKKVHDETFHIDDAEKDDSEKEDKGAYAYTLGRMSFGLFGPRDALLRVDDCYNMVRPLDVFERPRTLPDTVKDSDDVKKYNVKVRFTVLDPRAKGLKGTMTTYGYCSLMSKAADDASHRLRCWFVSGDLAPDSFESDDDRVRWADLFGKQPQNKTIIERATLWLANKALGISVEPVKPEGYQSYLIQKPPTGHVDVLYTDHSLRVTRGNKNSLVVMQRVTNLKQPPQWANYDPHHLQNKQYSSS